MIKIIAGISRRHQGIKNILNEYKFKPY